MKLYVAAVLVGGALTALTAGCGNKKSTEAASSTTAAPPPGAVASPAAPSSATTSQDAQRYQQLMQKNPQVKPYQR